jgi:outer membrane protein OmpA-like peptidoglycan-associated protein
MAPQVAPTSSRYLLFEMKYVLAIVLLAVVALAAAWYRAPAIEEALEHEVRTAMSREDLANVEVVVDGRDVVLAGEVSDLGRRELAERTAGAVAGVRTTLSRLSVAAPVPVPHMDVEDAAVDEEPSVVLWDSCQEEIDDLLAAGRIDFESSSADITGGSDALLDTLAEVLERCGAVHIEIAGHTDASGPRDENLELSLLRAEAVMGRLASAGVAAERLTAVGYGPDQPLVDNVTPDGRAQNRRIEFRVQHH